MGLPRARARRFSALVLTNRLVDDCACRQASPCRRARCCARPSWPPCTRSLGCRSRWRSSACARRSGSTVVERTSCACRPRWRRRTGDVMRCQRRRGSVGWSHHSLRGLSVGSNRTRGGIDPQADTVLPSTQKGGARNAAVSASKQRLVSATLPRPCVDPRRRRVVP